MSEAKKQTGIEKFKEKYGIDYDDLILLPIEKTGIYKQNYEILYDKKLTNVLAFGVRLIDILFILKIKDLLH